MPDQLHGHFREIVKRLPHPCCDSLECGAWEPVGEVPHCLLSAMSPWISVPALTCWYGVNKPGARHSRLRQLQQSPLCQINKRIAAFLLDVVAIRDAEDDGTGLSVLESASPVSLIRAIQSPTV